MMLPSSAQNQVFTDAHLGNASCKSKDHQKNLKTSLGAAVRPVISLTGAQAMLLVIPGTALEMGRHGL